MVETSITAKEIREARAFLQKRGFTTSDISPRDFAATAATFHKSFAEVLRLISHLKMKGQGEHPGAKTIQALRGIKT